jgi:hypothetical protein
VCHSQRYRQVYYFAIIDFLQDWSVSKKMERLAKTALRSRLVKQNLSAVPPVPYQRRFMKFMQQEVFLPASFRGVYECAAD